MQHEQIPCKWEAWYQKIHHLITFKFKSHHRNNFRQRLQIRQLEGLLMESSCFPAGKTLLGWDEDVQNMRNILNTVKISTLQRKACQWTYQVSTEIYHKWYRAKCTIFTCLNVRDFKS